MLLIERFSVPGPARDARALELARRQAIASLEERAVWCASAVSAGRDAAERLCARLGRVSRGGINAGRLDLAGIAPGRLRSSDDAVGTGIAAGDVVVITDNLAALLTVALRERGAHVVWQVRSTYLGDYTAAVDGYLAGSRERGAAGSVVERSTASLPAARIVATMETCARPGDHSHDVGWASTLAQLIELDRDESVGGTLQARPSVPSR